MSNNFRFDFDINPTKTSDPDDNPNTSEVNFITLLIFVIVAWILIALWARTVENLFFETWNLDGESFWQAFIVALSVTIVFLATVWFIDQLNLVPGSLTEDIEESQGLPT